MLALGTILGVSAVLQRAALTEIAPLPLAVFRLLAGLAFFVPLLPWLRLSELRSPRVLLNIGIVGTLSPGLSIVCLTLALTTASSGLVALLAALAPLFAALIGSIRSPDPALLRRQVAGLGAAFGGVILLLATRSTGLGVAGDGDVHGLLYGVCNALCFGASAVYARRRLRAVDPLTAAAGQTATGLVVLGLPALVLGLPIAAASAPVWAAVLLSGAIGLGGAFLLQSRMVQRHGSTGTLLALYVMPIVAGILGVAFLGEVITGPLAAGAVLVLLGLGLFTGPDALGTWRPNRRRQQPQDSPRLSLRTDSR